MCTQIVEEQGWELDKRDWEPNLKVQWREHNHSCEADTVHFPVRLIYCINILAQTKKKGQKLRNLRNYFFVHT